MTFYAYAEERVKSRKMLGMLGTSTRVNAVNVYIFSHMVYWLGFGTFTIIARG